MNSAAFPSGERVRKELTRRAAGFLRFGLVLFVIAVQIGIVFTLVWFLQERAVFLYFTIQVIAVIDIFLLTGKRRNASYTMAWVLLILLLPVTGHLLYVLWGRGDKHRRIRRVLARTKQYLTEDPAIYQALIDEHPQRKRICSYLGRRGFPLYQRTSCDYYPLGDNQFPAMLADIEKAQRFVFIETFIIDKGQLWDQFRELLARKVQEGVEIRLMYDDWGSLFTVPEGLAADMKRLGIQMVRFNPIHYSTNKLYGNYRNHQKICVIDGEIAHTGGTNLADEYMNVNSKFGHWKDTAIRLEGDAAWSLTVTFLQMWELQTQREQDFERYRPNRPGQPAPGFYQPFADGPMNSPAHPAEITYRSIIHNAQEYVYIMTPYLIIDNSMVDALCTAALGGTDVRIITPYIWDKWYVHMVTQSNYEVLLQSGVRIFEYSPGYMHAKTILSDDDHCITGTVNMDYRSFYLSYENAVWICGAPVLRDIKADFEETLVQCQEITLPEWQDRPLYRKIVQGVLRIFAIFL